ncbi:MAG: phenylalanine--tRNA ligase subunit alpha [Nitrospirota bacterium]
MSRDNTEIIRGLHPLEIKVLQAFRVGVQGAGCRVQEWLLWEDEIIERTGLGDSQVSMAIGWLQTKEIVESADERVEVRVFLTETGIRYADERLPEIRILDWVKESSPESTMVRLKESHIVKPEELSSAIGALKKSGILRIGNGGTIEIDQDETKSARFRHIQDIIESFKDKGVTDKEHSAARSEIGQGKDEDDETWRRIIEYSSKKRGGGDDPFKIYEKKARRYAIIKGREDILKEVEKIEGIEEVSYLDPEMLKDGSWRGVKFRRYNINLEPPRQTMGKKHPYREFLDLVKYKLVAMGFEEMRGGLVENEFWNMDALFMPQFHPAREIHDVYFIKDPKYAKEIKEPCLANVSAVHRNGWSTGSKGWLYDFDIDRAKRLILRSQGTAVSARKLADSPEIPGKYFSIARCFRYDQVDATHATDFFQIEGIVLGNEINFRTLLGLLQLFAKEVARAEEIKFIPAYFPFTEPSVELHVKHPRLGWMELGGAGLFRPEVVIPLGIDVPVIAWGLGLDRMAMVALDIHDIRDLFSGDLDLIKRKRIRR